MLVGRRRELEYLTELVHGERSAAVIRAGAGLGKTALLDAAADAAAAAGLTVLRARGIESETSLSFAGLVDLLRPVADRIDSLPPPQAAALNGALALGPPVPGDRLAVNVATVGVLAVAAPVIVLVDDVQWLDDPSREVVLFAARRAGALGAVGFVLVERAEPGAGAFAADLPELAVPPLGEGDSRELLARVAGDLDAGVRDTIVAAAAGNPLALVDLPARLSEDERRGRSPLRQPLPPGGAIERVHAGRIAGLPDATKIALAVAAACESDDLRPIAGACDALGHGAAALDPAQDAGLIEIADARVTFTHPLARAAAYRAVSAGERRSVHRALAAAVGDETGAWHLAAAAVGPDEDAAGALEATAGAAAVRRAYGVASDALERAAELSADDGRAAERLLGAGAAALSAGRPAQAERVLAAACERTDDTRVRARVEHLRGVLEMWNGDAWKAAGLLERHAGQIEAVDPRGAALMLADAAVAITVGGSPVRALAISERAHDLLGGDDDPGARAQVLSILSWSLILCGQTPRARPLLAELDELTPSIDPLSPAAQSLMLALNARHATEEFARAYDEAMAIVQTAREAGALFALGIPLIVAADAAHRLGRWDGLDAVLEEAMEVGLETGMRTSVDHARVTRARLAAAQGRFDLCRTLATGALSHVASYELHSGAVFAHAALGFMELCLGRIDEAIAELEEVDRLTAAGGMEEPSLIPWAPDLVEAYLRAGRYDDAERVCAEFSERAERAGTRGAAAMAARCQGSLADDFDPLFERAIELHDQMPLPFERARTLLAWGARLHRARRRADARVRLREARDAFASLGATPWSEYAEAELRAAGARNRARTADGDLTAQQLRVATAAASGATTREIAAELFLSPKTVESHLGQIYRKLGVHSRAGLARALPPLTAEAAQGGIGTAGDRNGEERQ